VSLAIDFSHEGMTPSPLSDCYRPAPSRDAWLERRTRAWGGSEIGALLVAYGLAPVDAILPGWLLEQTEHYHRLGLPKLLARKAGLRGRPKGDTASMNRGNERERELLARYKAQQLALPTHRRRVDPKTIRHADSLPKQFLPFVDRERFPLAVTPDAWARAATDGDLVMIEIKCTYKPLVVVRPPWHYRCQLQTEIAVCEARYGLLVVGECWVDDTAPDGPVRIFAMSRDEQMIALLRTVAAEAWEVVEELRSIALGIDALGDAKTAAAKREKKALVARCAETWEASRDRMSAYADPTRTHIEAALEEVDGLDEIMARQSA
jgi:hypothetical protein